MTYTPDANGPYWDPNSYMAASAVLFEEGLDPEKHILVPVDQVQVKISKIFLPINENEDLLSNENDRNR